MKPIRILLVERHKLVSAGLRALLESMPNVEVVAEAVDGYNALELTRKHHPDLVLMNDVMPKLSGFEVTRRIKKEHPKILVIILSARVDITNILRALYAGAIGYLTKNADPAELQLAIKSTIEGESYLSPAVSKRVIEDCLKQIRETSHFPEILTRRQREVLQLIAEGHTTKQIAQILSVGSKTVEAHRRALMKRLDIRDIAGLVRYAIRTDLVSPDE